MAGRLLIFLQRATYEPAYQAATIGITAAAMGDEVYFVLAFEALRQLVGGTFGRAEGEVEGAEAARARELGVPLPLQMLEDARGLGAKVLACDTAVKICGFGDEELAGKLDEVTGLPNIWRLADGARTLSF